jgi:hypothetical protein
VIVVPNIGTSYLIGSSTLMGTNGYPSHINNMKQSNHTLKYTTKLPSYSQFTRFYHGSGSTVFPSFFSKTWRSSEPIVPSVAFLYNIESVNSIILEFLLNSPLRFSRRSDFMFPEIDRSFSMNGIPQTFQNQRSALETSLTLSLFFTGLLK